MKKQSIYQFLEATSILESGTDEEIAKAKKQYWRQYKANWRKQKRKFEKQFIISLDSEQHKLISKAAKRHGRSITRYIKESTLAYSKTGYLIPNTMSLNYIREALTLNYNAVQQLEEETILSSAIEQQLVQKLTELESLILYTLTNPKTIEQAIIEAVQDNPGQKAYFLEILETPKP